MDLSEVRGAQMRHPWETARAVAIQGILRQFKVRAGAVLDYGCGDGFTGERVLSAIAADRLTGFDIHLTVEQCKLRSHAQVTYTNDWGAAAAGTFDLCLLCDVIEHVADDRALLEQVRGRLSATGHVLITVPAFQALFTSHDRALRHFRRYTLTQLEAVVRSAHFELSASGYLFASLLAGRGVSKLLEAMKPKNAREDFGIGAWSGSKALTSALETALNLDNSVLLGLASRGIKLPGLSAWALCKKRSS
jgi:SAM-dependent methyltransferase